MLINLSNHLLSRWAEDQIVAAKQLYGTIVDLPFPVVPPEANEEAVKSLADDYCERVFSLANGEEVVVHVMGEMTLLLSLVKRLQAAGITCVASTTDRNVVERPDGHKDSVFKFVQFRKYEQL